MAVEQFPRRGTGDVIKSGSTTDGHIAVWDHTDSYTIKDGGVPASGSVTTVSVVTANGVSGSVATSTTTPAITLTLGAITPTTVNGLTITTSTGTITVPNGVTSTFPAVTGTLTNRTDIPYDLGCQFVGVPAASAVGLRFPAVRAFTLSASGQKGTAGTAATAQTDFIVAVNGTTKATLRFAASGVTISVVGGVAATIAAGDVITITAPASPDATLADIGLTLTGVLI